MLAETDLIALMRHADDDQPDAGPAIEPSVDEGQLGSSSVDEHGGQGSPEPTTASVQLLGSVSRRGDTDVALPPSLHGRV
jgi:hypothetical protein